MPFFHVASYFVIARARFFAIPYMDAYLHFTNFFHTNALFFIIGKLADRIKKVAIK